MSAISVSDSHAPNGRSEDGAKSPSTSRRRSRERRHERSTSRHRSHREKDRDDSDRHRRDRDRERDRDDRNGHRRRRSGSRDKDYDRDRRREREERDRDRDGRRRKRDDSTEADGHSDHKRRKDTSVERKNGMDIDPKESQSQSSPVSPNVEDERRERDRRSPTTSSRRSGRDRVDLRSPRPDDVDRPRDRDRDRDYDRRRRSPGYGYDDRRRPYGADYDRPPRRDPPRPRRPSPGYDPRTGEVPQPDEDAEERSVFVSQLAARLTARDLAHFFEDKLGEGAVRDARIVTDRISRRSKGIAYVELGSRDLVSKAIALTGTVIMGLPINVQLTESERNRVAQSIDSLNLPPGVTAPPVGMQLYVGSLHFNLTESDIKQVFEPFGQLDFVDLHKDPQTGRSKGYAFVQYKRSEDAKMALEQMDGFELAGRQLRVNTVHEKTTAAIRGGMIQQDSLDEGGGTQLNNASRQALMQKLARVESSAPVAAPIMRPNIPTTMKSKNVLLKNMFNPEEETEPDWDKELESDVKEECRKQYGPVEAIKLEVESQGEIYVKFDSVETAGKAIDGLNGRWFGGRVVSAAYVSDAIMQAHI